jgi:rhodanese-related sulfurtransferase
MKPAASNPMQDRASRRDLLAAGIALFTGSWVLAGCAPIDPADAVTLEHARGEFEAGRAWLIDLREPIEHAGGVVKGAQLLPMSQLAARFGEIPTDPSRPLLLICNTQNRSRAALKTLRQRGLAHARYVDGGMSGWVRRGWPVVVPGR